MNANVTHSEIDNTIDRALSALRDAQPRAGLEDRILTSLEHRAAASQPMRFRVSTHLALWAATSAAILAIASLIILHHQITPTNAVILSEASHRDAQSKNPDTAHRATDPEPFSTSNLAIEPTHRTAHRLANSSTAMPAPCAQSGCPVHDGGTAVGMSGISQTPTDAQLLADLHAPSHPAPPLPLSSQEKLFLHMVRYGNLTELAELNPVVRAQHDDDETADFKAFFPDPPPIPQPNGDTE